MHKNICCFFFFAALSATWARLFGKNIVISWRQRRSRSRSRCHCLLLCQRHRHRRHRRWRRGADNTTETNLIYMIARIIIHCIIIIEQSGVGVHVDVDLRPHLRLRSGHCFVWGCCCGCGCCGEFSGWRFLSGWHSSSLRDPNGRLESRAAAAATARQRCCT